MPVNPLVLAYVRLLGRKSKESVMNEKKRMKESWKWGLFSWDVKGMEIKEFWGFEKPNLGLVEIGV